jgi:hypothetical protein
MLRPSLLLNRTPQRIANGPDLIRAGDAVRRAEKNRDAWPFPHVYPPVNSIRRDPMGYCLAPAVNAQAVILAWSVPSGFWFYMERLGLYYQGETFVFGGFLLTVDRNTPLGIPGIGSTETDLQNIPFPLGSFEHGPIELDRTQLFAPEDLIQAKLTNISVTPGTPNCFGAYFGGWLVPTIEVPDAQ